MSSNGRWGDAEVVDPSLLQGRNNQELITMCRNPNWGAPEYKYIYMQIDEITRLKKLAGISWTLEGDYVDGDDESNILKNRHN